MTEPRIKDLRVLNLKPRQDQAVKNYRLTPVASFGGM
jgi:hypothetical protein